MISSNITFVIGAGASTEFGLPMGAGLLSRIKVDLSYLYKSSSSRPWYIEEIIKAMSKKWSMKEIRDAASIIIENVQFSKSIDNILNKYDSLLNVVDLGKVAIASNIIRAERGEPLSDDAYFQRANKRYEELHDNWLAKLFSIAHHGIKVNCPERVFSNVQFIIFNYDRCVEHYLYQMLQVAFELKPQNATKIASDIKIIHPYGSIGKLEWGSRLDDELLLHFADVPSNLYEAARGIRTIGEFHEASEFEELRKWIGGSDKIVFLGFGYIRENLDLMKTECSMVPKRVFGTAYNISGINVSDVVDSLEGTINISGPGPDISALDTASSFMDNYERLIS